MIQENCIRANECLLTWRSAEKQKEIWHNNVFFLVNIIAWIAEVASFDYFTSTYVETMLHMRLHFRLLNYQAFFQQFFVYKISF